jgi:hypothetical protein
MGARLSSKRVQIAVACLLAAVIVYNAVHFLGKRTSKRTFEYQQVALEGANTQAFAPAWATGDYERQESWDTNPFTGRQSRPPDTPGTGERDSVTVEYGPPPESSQMSNRAQRGSAP